MSRFLEDGVGSYDAHPILPLHPNNTSIGLQRFFICSASVMKDGLVLGDRASRRARKAHEISHTDSSTSGGRFNRPPSVEDKHLYKQ